MFKKSRSVLIRIVAMALILALAMPISANAATAEKVQPRASDYLNSYSAYVYPAGDGKVHLCFSVTGTGDMDEIGYLRIAVHESTDNSTFTWVKSYGDSNNPEMMGYNTYTHSGYLTYQGVAGRYYKMYVAVWAGKDGGGDIRYFWTSAKLAY